MTYADVSDVTARLGRAATDEETQMITTLLADAERMIIRGFARASRVLADDIAALKVDVHDVIQVEAQAVLRVVRNPDGYVSETDGSYTYQLATPGDEMYAGCLEITPLEWEILGLRNDGMFQLVPNLCAPCPPSTYPPPTCVPPPEVFQ